MDDDSVRATDTRARLVAIAILLGLLLAPPLRAQKGGSGGGKGGGGNSESDSNNDDGGVPVCPQITGQHPLLESLTVELGLSCQQQAGLLPQMHNEEQLSRLLLAYAAFSPDERQAMLRQVDIAARNKVRPLLLPEQQRKFDVDAAGSKPLKKKSSKKQAPLAADAYASEEALSSALDLYSALTVAQKKSMLLQVKQAARREGAPALTAEQAAKIDGDIAVLQQ
jgi:hypothetical protein